MMNNASSIPPANNSPLIDISEWVHETPICRKRPLIDISEWVYETPICRKRPLVNSSPPVPPSEKMRIILQSASSLPDDQTIFLPLLPRNIEIGAAAVTLPSFKPRFELPLMLDLDAIPSGVKRPSSKSRYSNKLRKCSMDHGYARSQHGNDESNTEQKLSIGARCA